MNIKPIIDFNNFPTTRYQGSKRKILPWLYNNLKDLDFDTVLDAFGGTGSVSYLFKKMGKKVSYNDYLKFNWIIGKAIIENNDVILTSKELNSILNKEYSKKHFFITKNFENIYYLNEENIWIDNIIHAIQKLKFKEPALGYKSSIALYALFQSCLIKRPFNLFHRKNLNLRLNKVDRNFGNYKTWQTEFEVHYKKFIMEVNGLVFKGQKKCKALNKTIFDIHDENYDLVYLDPPYYRNDSSNETSNYLQVYHFLEGLANYNEWKNHIDYNSINLRFKEELSTENLLKIESLKDDFEKIFYKFQQSKIVLSYKSGGYPSIGYLTKLLKKFKKNVYTVSRPYKYALNHQNGNAKKNREVLIIGL